MLHWDFIVYLALGAVMGCLKGRSEKKALLPPMLRPWLALALLGLVLGLSFWKVSPENFQAMLQAGVNALAGVAALWLSFSWARWFFSPIRWS